MNIHAEGSALQCIHYQLEWSLSSKCSLPRVHTNYQLPVVTSPSSKDNQFMILYIYSMALRLNGCRNDVLFMKCAWEVYVESWLPKKGQTRPNHVFVDSKNSKIKIGLFFLWGLNSVLYKALCCGTLRVCCDPYQSLLLRLHTLQKHIHTP